MNKRYIILLLQVLEMEFKKRCEQAYWEQDRDYYDKWHRYVQEIIKSIEEGEVK